jgi:membrane protein
MVEQDRSGSKARTAPHPDDDRKPDELTALTKPTWKYILRKTVREFSKDQCTDLAAALTYYAVLALFPALLALVSLLSIFHQGPGGTAALMSIVKQVAPSAAGTMQGVVSGLTSSHAGGIGLIVGILAALWSASGYVGGFGRAMNRIYEIDEGRPFYKLRPMMLIVTVIAVVLAAVVALGLSVSGSVANAIGSAIGAGQTAVTLFNIVKWPLLLAVVIAVVAILYYATPNIKQPKFKWMSLGAGVAVAIWILASVGFGFYVANFSHYNKFYGSLAGVIVFLLWLWITNLALLFGAEIDSEVERGRQLQAGIAAEESLQLPPRDTKASDKNAAKDDSELAEARSIRRRAPDQHTDLPSAGRPGTGPFAETSGSPSGFSRAGGNNGDEQQRPPRSGQR